MARPTIKKTSDRLTQSVKRPQTGLVGAYVFISNEDSYKYGKISEKINEEYYLVDIYSGKSNTPTISLYHIGQMVQQDMSPDSLIGWLFFTNKKDLLSYVAWVEEPVATSTEDSNVVKFRPQGF
jgi:hypothetical protein